VDNDLACNSCPDPPSSNGCQPTGQAVADSRADKVVLARIPNGQLRAPEDWQYWWAPSEHLSSLAAPTSGLQSRCDLATPRTCPAVVR
jgi:hypothetical protein